MADKGPEREEGGESLSATAMFLRSFASAPQAPAVQPESPASVAPADQPPAEASEFTRMFRPTLPAEPARPSSPPPAPPVPPAAPSGAGDFTRAFVVPSPAEPPSTLQTAPAKAKGFSTPGVSDSASAEGSFTRMFRPDAQPLPQSRPSESYGREQDRFLGSRAATPASSEAPFLPEVLPQESVPPNSSITDMFRALSPEGEKYSPPSAYTPEPAPVPRPYAEPTRLTGPERPPAVAPSGGGVTELLSRLTAETPLMPGPPVPLAAPRPSVQQEPPVDAPPADTRGEFTRVIQAAEVQAALAKAPHPPPPAASGPATPLPVLSVTVPPVPVHVAHVAPVAPALPKIAVPAPPAIKVAAPALAAPAKSKLQEMVPLLLVANAFLMLVLILLVAFTLHRR